jgi:diguanylate cyclase (GGDEF)-like protein
MNDMESQSRPLYVFALPQTWARWAKDLPDWFLLPQAGLKGQTTPQLVLIEWAMAAERLAELFDDYRLSRHRVLLVVKSDREEGLALASRFGNDVCREALLGEQIGARWERMNRLAQRPGGDVLTGLMDRLSAMEALEVEIHGPYGGPLWFALFDLDNFKSINDQHGHEEGDRIIVAVADQLRRRFVDAPVLCRFGGNEFLLCLRMGRDEARERIEAFRASLGDLRLPKGEAVTISGGLGLHRPGESVKSLIERVEKNLYHAKANGRDRLVEDGESAASATTSSLDTGMLDFENRVKVYAERLVTGLTHHGMSRPI